LHWKKNVGGFGGGTPDTTIKDTENRCDSEGDEAKRSHFRR
jgi:hypothetical protein